MADRPVLRKLALSLVLVASARAADTGPVVTVTGGVIRGAALEHGGAVFKGIPYARPPVGPLRWREPSRVEPWTGVRDVKDYAPPCAQNPYFIRNAKDFRAAQVFDPDRNAMERSPIAASLDFAHGTVLAVFGAPPDFVGFIAAFAARPRSDLLVRVRHL